MKTYTTVSSNREYGFSGFVFAERPDSNRLYNENFGDCFYISEIEERGGLFLCHSDRALSIHAGNNYVTNPDWPVAMYRLGERVIVNSDFRGLSEEEDIIQDCKRTSDKNYHYALEYNGAWYDESELKAV